MLHHGPPEQLRAVAQLSGSRGHFGAALPPAGRHLVTWLHPRRTPLWLRPLSGAAAHQISDLCKADRLQQYSSRLRGLLDAGTAAY